MRTCIHFAVKVVNSPPPQAILKGVNCKLGSPVARIKKAVHHSCLVSLVRSSLCETFELLGRPIVNQFAVGLYKTSHFTLPDQGSVNKVLYCVAFLQILVVNPFTNPESPWHIPLFCFSQDGNANENVTRKISFTFLKGTESITTVYKFHRKGKYTAVSMLTIRL